jgi:hypothetical protein
MTRCNRVTPFGEIVADPARGAMLGNRGVLHDPATRRQRTVPHPIATLPDAAMVALPDDLGGAWLVLGDTLRRWDMAGYGAARPRPASGWVTLLTPLPGIAVLAAGYRSELHPSLRTAP